MQGQHRSFIPLIKSFSEDLMAFRRFFIRDDLQFPHITRRENQPGIGLRQHWPRGRDHTIQRRRSAESSCLEERTGRQT